MPGLLVLMGSGETSPTMVEIHRAAARTLRAGARAVLLDTPYAFQENRADISARARGYFARSVGLDVEVAPAITGADWVFSGPGSPTYALDRWAGSGVAGDLRARIRARTGVTVLASAAACTAGLATVPVYEIYKVGAEPHWREGVDLLEPLGLRAVLIPHFDNAEGGTHDTRYCYLGERRLSRMERELPPGTAVLGLDEHTALIIDLESESVRVAGRGGLTVRRPGSLTVLPTGTTTDLGELRRLAEGRAGTSVPPPRPDTTSAGAPAEVTLEESIRSCEELFAAAADRPDMVAAAQAVLDLEAEIVKWAADTEEDSGGVEQARELMRLLIARLGERAQAADRRSEGLPALVEPLLALRAELRGKGCYDVADALRDAMGRGGVAVEDTPDGPRWSPAS
ncbi:CysS/YqeB C-terminal domain-containing protein [Nonomuraea rubra]